MHIHTTPVKSNVQTRMLIKTNQHKLKLKSIAMLYESAFTNTYTHTYVRIRTYERTYQ